MFFLSLVVSFFFFFLLPYFVIPKLSEKWRSRFSALILANFIVLFAAFYFVSLLPDLAFLGDVLSPIIWSFAAYFFLRNKFAHKPETNQSDTISK